MTGVKKYIKAIRIISLSVKLALNAVSIRNINEGSHTKIETISHRRWLGVRTGWGWAEVQATDKNLSHA